MTKKQLEILVNEINELVQTDFCFDMDCKQGLPNQPDFTQEESIEMSRILGLVYMKAHIIHCNACRNTWERKNDENK